MTFRTGERVRVTFRFRTVEAVVLLASQNGRSLALGFEAILGGYVGMMPVLDPLGSGAFVDLVNNEPVVIERDATDSFAARARSS